MDEPTDSVADAIDQLRTMTPSPLVGTRGLGFVALDAWAVDVAADLHRRFPELQILVGRLRYPERVPERNVDADSFYSRIPILDPHRYEVKLDGPLTVPSGMDGHHRLMVANRTSELVTLWTSGGVTAHAIDPSTGRVVGVTVRPHLARGVSFEIPPGGTASVPLTVGTASLDPTLGYAVPPGQWDMQAQVALRHDGDTADYLTPPLPFEIT